MVYRILFTTYAKNSIQKLPIKDQERIDKSLLRIKVRPLEFVEKMINHPYFKLRVGKYRLILDIIERDLVVLVVEVGHRRNIYKRFG